jgi:pimeloyl-ACP methyl ester carboxylesterase
MTYVSVKEGGNTGSPLVFIHSFAGDASHWEDQVRHFAPTHRVIAIELSGHGSSSELDEPYSIARLARDVVSAVHDEHLAPFVLVGHSLGSLVAAAYAAENASHVSGLVLEDPPPALGAYPQELLDHISKMLDEDPYATLETLWSDPMVIGPQPAVRERLYRGLRRMSRRAVTELMRDLMVFDGVAALSRYPGPKTCIVTPHNDGPKSLHHATPGVGRVVIPGTGHWIHLDAPDEFNRALEPFVKKV